MTSDQGADKWAYQRLLIDQANAEMGRQRVSRRELMRLTGIPDATMNRIFTCKRDMNVAQWEAIARALGFGERPSWRHGHAAPPDTQRQLTFRWPVKLASALV